MRSGKRAGKLRRIAVITGSRADYGLLRSTIKAVSSRRGVELQLIATGMHLLKKFGHTVDDITGDGWKVDARIPMQSGDDSANDQAKGLSRGIAGVAAFCAERRTDVVVVLGDRIEAMAGALAGVTTGLLVAHIHGGDIAPGDFDDSLRHAITKLAHVHCVASAAAMRRIIRMGEERERVHLVGAPGLDRLMELVHEEPRGATRSEKALVVHHPRGRSCDAERRTMRQILSALRDFGMQTTIVYPNTDRGHSGITDAIEVYRRGAENGTVRVHRSLERDDYLRLLIESDVLVGNSSSGIIEAPVAGTPSVNIGPRQLGRKPAGASVVDAGECRDSIMDAIRVALRKRPIRGRSPVYGNGGAGDGLYLQYL